MSTEYYLVCHDRKVKFWVCSDSITGPRNQLKDNRSLAAFLTSYDNSAFHLINEHESDENYSSYKELSDLDWKEIIEGIE